MLAERISLLQSLHVYYLTSPPLHGVFSILLREGLRDQELLEETRRAFRVNPYFELLADLYEMYLSDIGLIHDYVERGEIVPCASCKIYELWVLTRIVDFLERRLAGELKAERRTDHGLALSVGGVRVLYNVPQRGVFLQGVISGVKRDKKERVFPLRPDFVIVRNSGEKSGSVVCDAKYRRGVGFRDVITMLAYIAEFAWPITLGGERVMLGVFYKLRDSASRESVRVVKNENLPVKLAIYIYTLDPRMKRGVIEKNVEESLKPILETKVQVV